MNIFMRITRYILIIMLFLSYIGCKKADTVINTDTQVGHSRIVFFPSIAIKGEHLIILKQGDTYTDAGVTAILNGQPTQSTVTGSVNSATPGVYDLDYSASNPEGYSASDWRTVVVIGNDVTNNDFSGTYLRAATGINSTWKKTANGVYEVDNPGGAGVGAGYKVIVVNYQGNRIKIPRQIAVDPTSGAGVVSSRTETYNASASPVTYSWVFLAGGYGTALRTFTKQ